MHCWIYKGSRRAETYLYVAERDGFARVPGELLRALGELELVMEIDLHADGKLARAEPRAVMEDLRANGYFLQMPPPTMTDLAQ